jgi:ABC-2 type transport system permease protein
VVKKFKEKYRYSMILLRELVKTDFKLRYEGSVLGMVWSALKPLLLFGVMYVVFVHFLKFGAGIPYFAAALLLAIVLWSFFQESTSQGMTAIVRNGDTLRKINIPKYVIVVSATVSALINLGINLVSVLIFALISGVQFSWTALLIIPIIIELYIFSLSAAMILSALYVKFRDLAHIWDVVMQAAYFATPIIYPLSMIMAMSATAAKGLLLSPMTQMIQDARNAMIYDQTETVWNTLGNPWLMCIPFVIVIIIAFIAFIYFRRASKHFTELV